MEFSSDFCIQHSVMMLVKPTTTEHINKCLKIYVQKYTYTQLNPNPNARNQYMRNVYFYENQLTCILVCNSTLFELKGKHCQMQARLRSEHFCSEPKLSSNVNILRFRLSLAFMIFRRLISLCAFLFILRRFVDKNFNLELYSLFKPILIYMNIEHKICKINCLNEKPSRHTRCNAYPFPQKIFLQVTYIDNNESGHPFFMMLPFVLSEETAGCALCFRKLQLSLVGTFALLLSCFRILSA